MTDENENHLESMGDAHMEMGSDDKQSVEASNEQSRDSLQNSDQTAVKIDNGKRMIVNKF